MSVLVPTESSRVDELDFSMVKMKLRREGWSEHTLVVAEQCYRWYLELCLLYPDKDIVPCELVDHFWHQHILDTRAYRNDCLAAFGYVLDHYPYFGLTDEEPEGMLVEAYDSTVRLYKDHFGVDLLEMVSEVEDMPWEDQKRIGPPPPNPAHAAYCSGPCGPSGCKSR